MPIDKVQEKILHAFCDTSNLPVILGMFDSSYLSYK